tara:strand:+ start:484 stop:729 length:246 start_codon:yes stop_codon:yes gene_type:complete
MQNRTVAFVAMKLYLGHPVLIQHRLPELFSSLLRIFLAWRTMLFLVKDFYKEGRPFQTELSREAVPTMFQFRNFESNDCAD